MDQNDHICDPSNDWEPLKFHNIALKDVCIQKDYQNIEPPNKDRLVPLWYFFQTSRILEVNEAKKTIELDVKLKLAWEEPRIKAKFIHGYLIIPGHIFLTSDMDSFSVVFHLQCQEHQIPSRSN